MLTLLLIRPTRYDEDGYVVRHWKGTLPSNTLSCLQGLTRAAMENGALGSTNVRIVALDEAVDLVEPRRLSRRFRRAGPVVVALAGVQTNQFPRARDLALAFRAEGCAVMIGGFHVSGSIAMSNGLPPDLQDLADAGITVVAGEVEDHWADLLRDAAAGRLRPVYNFLQAPPVLVDKPLPMVSPRLARKFAVRRYGTIDAGRGCPFQCSFCTIINVQGRTMRTRGAAQILDHVRRAYAGGRGRGLRQYFFTDDNFSRNPQWEAIFDGLIHMRREEGIVIDFMMQVDIAASRIPRFTEKAAAAGCVQVFIGMESLREDNLRAAGKRQNRTATYHDAIRRWHEAGVVCHVGFIIGFPHDTFETAIEDVRALRDRLHLDQASFFMLTPLPGSMDHRALVAAGAPMDADYNNFDSFHATTPHPRMSTEEWTSAYRRAWTEFYTFEHMREALLRQNPHTYWGLFKCYLWYRASMVEGAHPMVTGFLRLKHRLSRRPGLPVEGRVRFTWRRARETMRLMMGYGGLLLEMLDLWWDTRLRRRDYAGLIPSSDSLSSRAPAVTSLKLAWGRIHQTIRMAAGARSTWSRREVRLMRRAEAMERATSEGATAIASNAQADSTAGAQGSRGATLAYWSGVFQSLRTGRVWRVNPVRMAWHASHDLMRAAAFAIALAGERF